MGFHGNYLLQSCSRGLMKITYDPEVDAMNIKFQSGKYSISNEIADGTHIPYLLLSNCSN